MKDEFYWGGSISSFQSEGRTGGDETGDSFGWHCDVKERNQISRGECKDIK